MRKILGVVIVVHFFEWKAIGDAWSNEPQGDRLLGRCAFHCSIELGSPDQRATGA
jgi:hypothetical protein